MTAIEQESTIHFVQKTSESNVVCFAENMLGKSQLLIQIPNARKLENTKGKKIQTHKHKIQMHWQCKTVS